MENEIIHNTKWLKELFCNRGSYNLCCSFLTCPDLSCAHANNKNVIMTCRVLVEITAFHMTASGDANIGVTCFNLLCC